ncbi:protein-L-isoaspartate(D-aspartate) O-methyltransferase [Streptomyces sp. NPDC126503]|uniref:protein-L-isoaspartate(D-aspartate) O-methyltransferase n=1 Tax=Streptomyces sp. NPDC126503 TaxID=3155315 RepID=UPI003328968F
MDDGKREAGLKRLASALLEGGSIESDWLSAFHAVPRDAFLPDRIWPGVADGTRQSRVVDRSVDPEAWFEAAYSDIPLTTQWDEGRHTGDDVGTTPTSSNSLPTMVFTMLKDLGVQPGHQVMEIGTGTGWTAGLLSYTVGQNNVTTIEYDPEVAHDAARNLLALGVRPTLLVGDGRRGYPRPRPYDRVIATCSVGSLPYAWVEQTAPGGVIVAPWGPTYGGEAIVRLVVRESGVASGHFTRSSAFMRLRQQRAERPGIDAYLRGERWPAGADMSRSSLSPADVGGWVEQFVIGVLMPDTFWRTERYDDGSYTLWTYSLDTESWASADFEPGATTFEVAQSGPRRLWDETESAFRWWEEQGRPGFERFGLSVSREGERVWLDGAGHVVTAVSASE